MGSKVHPKIFRMGTVESADSTWFAKKDFKAFLREDVLIRAFLKKHLRESAIHKIQIDRSRQTLTITIYTAKPGFIIGRAGSGIEDLKKMIMGRFFRGRRIKLNLNVQDIGQGSLSADVVAMQIALDIEKRMPFRRVMKQTVERVIKAGAKGVRIIVSGRLNGADIARAERVSEGKVPLQNLRADVHYAHAEAGTTFGVIGVKVWIYRGELFGDEKVPNQFASSFGGRRDDRRGGRGPRRDNRGRSNKGPAKQ